MQNYVLKCLLKISKLKYQNIHLVASVASGLLKYHDSLAIRLVDSVIEDIRVGMEVQSLSRSWEHR